tara:strand:- start:612 stop:2798 length:2187 start_codon:yes stop_codon:yes gene_type:complete
MTTLYSKVATSIIKDSPAYVLPGGLAYSDMIVTSDTFKQTLNSLPNVSEWIIDVETNGLNPYDMNQICGIGLVPVTDKDSQIYYFPFRHQAMYDEPFYKQIPSTKIVKTKNEAGEVINQEEVPTTTWVEDTDVVQYNNLSQAQLNELVGFINDNCKSLIGYNVKFDAKFLENEGIDIPNMNLVDVLVMVRMTEPTTMNRLSLTDTIIRSYGENAGLYDVETKKILRKHSWNKNFAATPPHYLGPYCVQDVYWTRKVYQDRLRNLELSNQLDLFRFQNDLTKTLYMMEKRGVLINNNYAKEAYDKTLKRIDILKNRIYKLVGYEFNISSTKQLGETFNAMGIHSPLRTAKGAEAWNEEALVRLNSPLAGLIRQYRALEKIRSTYIEPYLELPVLHTSFNNWGTVTGRLSSSSPNLQNIPRDTVYIEDRQLSESDKADVRDRVAAIVSSKGGNANTELTDDVLETWSFLGGDKFNANDDRQIAIRNLFIPRNDYKMIAYDYSQMEVRVFMSYVDNKEMNELMKQDDVDFHGEAAKIAFNIAEDDSQFKFFRQLAKSITFGVIYGIGKDKLALQLNTTPDEAAQYKNTYLENMKGSRKFFNAVIKKIKADGKVRNKYGRVYRVPSEFGYKGVNYLIQGTSADIMSERMVAVAEYLKDKKSNLLLQVHDEIICEVHKDEVDDVAPEIRRLMKENTLNIPLEVDMEVCDPSWAVKKDFDDINKFNLEEHIDWD